MFQVFPCHPLDRVALVCLVIWKYRPEEQLSFSLCLDLLGKLNSVFNRDTTGTDCLRPGISAVYTCYPTYYVSLLPTSTCRLGLVFDTVQEAGLELASIIARHRTRRYAPCPHSTPPVHTDATK